MPSSTDRKRLEVPTYLHERLVDIAIEEDRTVSSVVQEVLITGLSAYIPRRLSAQDDERLTERARLALDYAREEAVPFNHNYIGTEHLLLGLLRVEEGVAARVLNELGVTLETVRERLGTIVGKGKGKGTVPEYLPYVPRARLALRLAVEEADSLDNHYIGTEHLLLALIRVREGMAARILDRLGVLDTARLAVLHLLTEKEEKSTTAGA